MENRKEVIVKPRSPMVNIGHPIRRYFSRAIPKNYEYFDHHKGELLNMEVQGILSNQWDFRPVVKAVFRNLEGKESMPLNCLIDTGSHDSFISQKVINLLNLSPTNEVEYKVKDIQLREQITRQYELTMLIANHSFRFIPLNTDNSLLDNYDAIIGVNFICAYNGTLVYNGKDYTFSLNIDYVQ